MDVIHLATLRHVTLTVATLGAIPMHVTAAFVITPPPATPVWTNPVMDAAPSVVDYLVTCAATVLATVATRTRVTLEPATRTPAIQPLVTVATPCPSFA